MTEHPIAGMSWAEKALRELSQGKRIYSYQWRTGETGSGPVHTLSVEGKLGGFEKLDHVEGDFSDALLSQCASSTNEVARLEVKVRLSGMVTRFETRDAIPISSSSSTKPE